MARELHDIAAHHLSGIALMTSAIDRQLATDPQAARDGVRQVRAQSMAVLDDLRRLVGLLRDPSESVEAVQTLDTLPSLLDVARSAGSPVRLDVVPRAGSERLGDGVGPLGQLAAYRMVQESLTNAVTHAPAAASTVTLDDSDDDRFVVTVQTEATPARPHAAAAAGRPAPGGFGILGMRERAALVGGTLASGPTPDGGWLTRMELPRDGRRSTGPEEGTRP
jgi:signal transduction histidine kinase